MQRALVEWLSCPECRSDLSLEVSEETAEGVKTGWLICPRGHRYPISNTVPRFFGAASSVANFSLLWTRFSPQSITRALDQRKEFAQKTGFSPEAVKDRVVLDAGCGIGRFIGLAREYQARSVIGVDASAAIDQCVLQYGRDPCVHLIQADLARLPLKPGMVDVIFSSGVLMCTPKPRETFQSLLACLRPGGTIAVWVYDAYDKLLVWVSRLYRRVTLNLPHRLLFVLCGISVPLYWLYKPLYRVPGLNKTLAPLLLRCFFIALDDDWRLRWLNTFDWYSTPYQYHYSYYDIFQWFEQGGLERIKVLPQPVGMQGTKPG